MNDRIDTDAVKASARIEDVIGSYLQLRRNGKELRGLCPFHADKNPSLCVVPHKQFFICPSCGEHGDVIDFVMKYDNVDFPEACRRVAGGLVTNGSGKPKQRTVRPAEPERRTTRPPDDAGEPHLSHSRYGKPAHVWHYRDHDGLQFIVARYEYVEHGKRRKLPMPFTYGSRDGQSWAWGPGAYNGERILLNTDRLGEDSAVLLVEGETCADAGHRLLGRHYVAMTWSGGCQAWRKTRWTALAGRRVLLWPDNDKAGVDAMQAIGEHLLTLGCAVRIVVPSDKPDGWDLADAEAEGMDTAAVIAFAKQRVQPFAMPADDSPPPPEPGDPGPSAPPSKVVPIRGSRTASVDDGNTARKVQLEELPAKYSEDEAAKRFTRKHGDEMAYVSSWGRWLHWDGTRWAHDETQVVVNMARDVCREVAVEVQYDMDLQPPSKRERVANTYGACKTIMAVERLARSDRVHAASPGQWDSNEWLLNTPDGVVDLTTGQLRPARRDDFSTKITAVGPGDPSGCVRWLDFLTTATDNDVDLMAFMQRMAGYCLTATIREHALFFVYGTGGNGKGTFINTLQWIMGDYAQVAGMDVFTEQHGSRHPTELASLMGARLVTAQETEDGKRWNEQRLKALTGGDPIRARFMRMDEFTFYPQFKLVIAGNHKPGLRNVDEAIKRRLYLIPFTVTIPAERRDAMLAEALRAEARHILAWAVEGCQIWQKVGLQPPERVKAATQEYLDDEDTLRVWIADCCEVGANKTASSSALYRSYKAWSERSGEYVLPQKRWKQKMESKGYEDSKYGGVMTYRGISVVENPPDHAEEGEWWNR